MRCSQTVVRSAGTVCSCPWAAQWCGRCRPLWACGLQGLLLAVRSAAEGPHTRGNTKEGEQTEHNDDAQGPKGNRTREGQGSPGKSDDGRRKPTTAGQTQRATSLVSSAQGYSVGFALVRAPPACSQRPPARITAPRARLPLTRTQRRPLCERVHSREKKNALSTHRCKNDNRDGKEEGSADDSSRCGCDGRKARQALWQDVCGRRVAHSTRVCWSVAFFPCLSSPVLVDLVQSCHAVVVPKWRLRSPLPFLRRHNLRRLWLPPHPRRPVRQARPRTPVRCVWRT